MVRFKYNMYINLLVYISLVYRDILYYNSQNCIERKRE